MATQNYPVDLPSPSLEGFNYSLPAATLTNGPNAGKPVNFQYTYDEAYQFTFKIVMRSEEQLAEFLDWYYIDLVNGSRWFNMELPWQVDSKGETRELECNFLGQNPRVSNNGRLRILNVVISVRFPPQDTKSFTEGYLALLPYPDPEAFLDRLEVFANEDLEILP